MMSKKMLENLLAGLGLLVLAVGTFLFFRPESLNFIRIFLVIFGGSTFFIIFLRRLYRVAVKLK